MSFMRFLAKPFPIIEGNRNKFKTAFAFGFFVFVFLYFFSPFGLGKLTNRQILLYTLGFGGNTFIIMLINLLFLSKLFPRFFKEEKWTIGKEIFITLFYIAVIGLGNYFFATKVLITKATFNNLLYIEFISLCLAIFPVVVWTLVRENMLLKQNMKEAEKFLGILKQDQYATNAKLMPVNPEPLKPAFSLSPFIKFTSENEATIIETEPTKLTLFPLLITI